MFAAVIRLAVFLSVLSFGTVSAVPVRELSTSSPVTRATRAVPSAPHWVAYSDEEADMPSSSDIEGYNVFILSFLLVGGAADVAAAWERLSDSERSSILDDYHGAGISLMVSAFGATDAPTTQGADPTDTANTMAQWVKDFGVDGIDVDYEDFDAVDQGTAGQWVETFVRTLRKQLPSGQFIVTGAPIAPWFTTWFAPVDAAVGDMFDWYNIQFYSQGSEYTTCDGLINHSGGQFPSSSLFEIADAGFPLDKLVVGKPGTPDDASGFIDPSVLAGCVADAKDQGWNAGVMVWEWPDAPSSWIKTVRSQAFPLAGAKSTPKGTPATSSSAAKKPKGTSASSSPVAKKPKTTSGAQ